MIRPPPRSPLFPSPPLSRSAEHAQVPALFGEKQDHFPPIAVRQRRDHARLAVALAVDDRDRKSTRLNSSHSQISYAVFCLKKKKYPTYTRYLTARLTGQIQS